MSVILYPTEFVCGLVLLHWFGIPGGTPTVFVAPGSISSEVIGRKVIVGQYHSLQFRLIVPGYPSADQTIYCSAWVLRMCGQDYVHVRETSLLELNHSDDMEYFGEY